MRVKICGIRSAVDVDLVNAYRPDWIGLVIDVPSSFRSVTIEQARALSKRVDEGIGVVGVFVDCPLDTIASLLEDGVIAMAQLHGSQSEADVAWLREKTGRPVLRAFEVKSEQDIAMAQKSGADFVLLDGGKGQGKPFDWTLLKGMTRPFGLAGGVDVALVEAARQAGASWIDVSSAVETDQKKDGEKMKALIARCRRERQ
ncbi:phosphoribosylanthranilate isomerase [uncultured Dubosiella sp.]|uniref:phosphoribosylanthranilate isomerase n=1 Tax=uncultured Dubosiella sp. TaxID=1937011 RepID=UPI00259B77CA|nr:phosphoribosylanthranilate isomerase [uncultured Dubosiella sp.]